MTNKTFRKHKKAQGLDDSQKHSANRQKKQRLHAATHKAILLA
jgi:hypothetical protein